MAKDLIAKENKISKFEQFFPYNPDSCRLTVVCPRAHYAASAIARAVEDADASLLNLNVTSLDAGEGFVSVDIRVDHRDPQRVIRSLERYGFTVTGTDATTASDDTLRRRYDELMKIINI